MKVHYIVLFIIIFLSSFIVPTKTVHSFEKQDISNNNQSPSSIEFISSIGGVQNTVAVDGGYAYIGEGAGLRIVDVRDPSEPASVVYLPLSAIPTYIQIGNGYAYIANDVGLQIIDIQDVTKPMVVTNLCLGPSYGLSIVDNLVYVAAGRNGLQIVDVSTPTNPVIIGSHPGWVTDVEVLGQYAYVVQQEESSSDIFVILDIHNPANPIPQSSLAIYRLTDLVVVETIVYAISHGVPAIKAGQLYTIDVSNTIAPTIRDEIDIPHTIAIEVTNGHAYMPNYVHVDGMTIVDVSDPTNLQRIGQHRTAVTDISIVDSIAYMVGNGLEMVNIANPASPTQQSYLPLVSDTIVRVEAMAGIAYVLSDAGLYTLDISDITKPRLLGHYAVSQFYQFQIQGSLAYIGSRHEIHLVDVSDPRNPILVSQINFPYIAAMQVLDDQMYVYSDQSDFQDDLYIFDVSNPAEPQQIERINVEGLISVNNLAVIDNQIFVLSSYTNANEDIAVGELHRIDISDPERAILINSYKTDSYLRDMEIIGNYIYLVGQEYLHILDREGTIRLISKTDTSRKAISLSDVKVHNDIAYITSSDLYGNSAAIHLLDVSNPAQPLRLGQIDPQGGGSGINVIDGLVYIANGRQGLRVVRVQPELIPPEIFLPLIWV